MLFETLDKERVKEETGYEMKTTFYDDFSIADHFGLDAIQDTYDRCFDAWKDDIEFVTELDMVLNWKCWHWYQKNTEYSRLYTKLYEELRSWIIDNKTEDEVSYYLRTTD